MKEIIGFLRQLEGHNERPWFMAHKEEFLALQSHFHGFVAELIAEVGRFDPDIASLTARDCTYRIYRDTRFSADKTPYKTHLGAFLCPGGRKSGYCGYYFQIGTGSSKGYPAAHMLAAGDYCFTPSVLRVLREDISAGGGDFDAIVRKAAPTFDLDREGMLSRLPKGFPADSPWPEYLRLKSYCLCHYPDDGFICAPGLAHRVAEMFQTTKPFLDYLNRAIAYDREMS